MGAQLIHFEQRKTQRIRPTSILPCLRGFKEVCYFLDGLFCGCFKQCYKFVRALDRIKRVGFFGDRGVHWWLIGFSEKGTTARICYETGTPLDTIMGGAPLPSSKLQEVRAGEQYRYLLCKRLHRLPLS
jgi:hypothetical protein